MLIAEMWPIVFTLVKVQWTPSERAKVAYELHTMQKHNVMNACSYTVIDKCKYVSHLFSLSLSLSLSLYLSPLSFTQTSTHRTVEYLDLEQGKWVAVENMLSRRSTLGVAVFNGELYAVGGFDGTTGLDTVEKYNPST